MIRGRWGLVNDVLLHGAQVVTACRRGILCKYNRESEMRVCKWERLGQRGRARHKRRGW
jgi:hypothetical protein